jgi:hypothetical protein
MMWSSLFLRIASVLTLLHGIAHTIGVVFGADADPTPEETAVLQAMKSHRFEMMGSLRSFWDFFLGYGLFISIAFLTQAILFWWLASLARKAVREIRPITACFSVAYLGFAILAWNYFFLSAVILEGSIAICLGAAYLALRSSRDAAGVRSAASPVRATLSP